MTDEKNDPAERNRRDQDVADQGSVEETPVDRFPSEQTSVEQTSVEQTSVEQTPVEQTPVEQTPAEQTPVEQTPPPLIPPPVRRSETGEQPYANRSNPTGSGDPVFVEPNAERTGADPVFSDPAVDAADRSRLDADHRSDASGDDRPRVGSVEDSEFAPADRAPAPAARYPVDGGASVGEDRVIDDRGSARDVVADREAVRETSRDAEPVTVAHAQTAPDAAPAPVFVPASEGGVEQTAAYPPARPFQREFLEPPVEPKKKGNRGVGSIIAILSVILFAVIYALIAAAIIASQRPQDLGDIFIAFVKNPLFWIPAIIFVVAFVIVVLLANRAGWWAYVLGSLLVGALVYFGTIGVALVLANPTTLTAEEAGQLITLRAIDPFLITAALVAREVSLWTGSAIASRGRRMKSRNLTARDEYDRASAEHRAAYERSYPTAG